MSTAESFEVFFQSPLTPAAGVVCDLDITLIDERVPAAAGGEYIHHAFGMITIAKKSPGIYSILALSMFNRAVGWCPIIVDEEYCPVGNFWDTEG